MLTPAVDAATIALRARSHAGAAIGRLGDDRLRRGVDQAVEQGAVA
jgi:hypothetical protein